MQHPFHASHPPKPPRRGGRIVGAALLVGALAGGAAGVAGAAAGRQRLVQRRSAQLPTHSAAAMTASHRASLPPTPRPSPARRRRPPRRRCPSVVKIYASGQQGSGSGSGIILTDDGEILTNNHVVEIAADGGELAVSFNDGRTAKATIVGRDPLTDLAVIQAEDVSGLTPATLGDSDDLAVGQQVVAVGSPFGLESTVTTGIVSALNRPVTTQGESSTDPATVFPAIQTDAAINPGNSGGPLIDMNGQVVGIDSAIRTAPSSGGEQGGSIGLGFAIPINDAIPIVEELRDGETADPRPDRCLGRQRQRQGRPPRRCAGAARSTPAPPAPSRPQAGRRDHQGRRPPDRRLPTRWWRRCAPTDPVTP